MATEDPREGQIKSCGADNQGRKNEKLHEEPRMYRERGIVVSEPAPHYHNARAQGGLSEGSQYLHRSHSPVAQAKNNKQREEIKKAGNGCRQRGTAVLHALEEKLQKNDGQQDGDDQRNRHTYHRCCRMTCRVESCY